MNEILKNPISQSIIAALVVSIMLWLFKFILEKGDETKIVEFLKRSKVETTHKFRSTHALASQLNMGEEKIRKICNKSSKIIRNEKEKESWRLAR